MYVGVTALLAALFLLASLQLRSWERPQPRGAVAQNNHCQLPQSGGANQPQPPTNVLLCKETGSGVDRGCCTQCCCCEKTEKPAFGTWDWWFDSPITLFTGLLVLVGAIQAYFLWRAIKSSETALVTTQRAFVFINRFEPHPRKDVLRVLPIWENSGTTPAENLRNYANWRPFVGGIPDDYRFPDLDADGNEIVGPGETYPIFLGPKATFYAEILNVRRDAIEAAWRGEMRILLWGWAEYDDAFGKPHKTEFCNELMVWGFQADGEAWTAEASFRLHPRHNTAR